MAGYQHGGNRNYQSANKFSGGQSRGTQVASKPVDSSVVLSTGLFAPDNEKSKATATIKLKEAVTIPAGAYINLYKNEDRKSDKSPIYRVQVRMAAPKPVK